MYRTSVMSVPSPPRSRFRLEYQTRLASDMLKYIISQFRNRGASTARTSTANVAPQKSQNRCAGQAGSGRSQEGSELGGKTHAGKSDRGQVHRGAT